MNTELIDLAHLFQNGDIIVDTQNSEIRFKGLRKGVDSESTMIAIVNEDEQINNAVAHVSDEDNPHKVTKADIGLENVDNTSDLEKPISTAILSELEKYINKETEIVTNIPETIAESDKTKVLSATAGKNIYDAMIAAQDQATFDAEIAALTARIATLENTIPVNK